VTGVLELSHVTKAYPGTPPVTALDDVSLEIADHEIVAIVGPSGSGKSTLLHLAGTLERATSGLVRVAGQDVGTLDDRELSVIRRHQIGFVFQQFFLLEHLDVVENVAQRLLYCGVPARERARDAVVALERVGLGHRLRHRPRDLSGGERQRVAIARATVRAPAVLLADEPTGNLDSASGQAILDLLADVHARGSTVVVITHDREIARVASRCVEVRDGHVVRDERDAR